jgi:hypothetical protein
MLVARTCGNFHPFQGVERVLKHPQIIGSVKLRHGKEKNSPPGLNDMALLKSQEKYHK